MRVTYLCGSSIGVALCYNGMKLSEEQRVADRSKGRS